jgi:hypothetical protein
MRYFCTFLASLISKWASGKDASKIFFRLFSALIQYKFNVILILRRLRIRGSSFHVDSYIEEFFTSFSNVKSRMLRSQQTQESTQNKFAWS